MPVRLVITTHAKPGKGTELAQAMADRCRAVQQEPGCLQYEVFQSALDPDTLLLLELWAGCGLTRQRSTRTRRSTPRGRQTRCWPLSALTVSDPEKTTLTI